jgi:hypothetical protein
MLSRQVKSFSRVLQKLGKFDLAAAIERGELQLSEAHPQQTLGPGVIEAVSVLTNADHLAKCGLELTNTGQVANPRMRSILLNKRQLEALRALGDAEGRGLPA